MRRLAGLLLLLALTPPARPDDGLCGSGLHCPSTSSWQYEPGRVYRYLYTVDTATAMKGASEQQSTFTFSALAEIGVESQCQLVLKLSRVQAGKDNSPEAQNFAQVLQRHNSNFFFDSGRIREVCSSSNDPLWAVNLKKGVLSAFQQSISSSTVQQNVTETDVVGRCDTQYTPTGTGWGKSSYTKVKHMYSCTGNREMHQYALNLPDMNIQHLPILETTHKCEVSLQSGILSRNDCQETHRFQPFSNQASGPTTTVTQSLVLQSEDESKLQSGDNAVRGNLMFVHDHKQSLDATDEDFVRELLDRVSDSNFQHSDLPALFRSLVYSMKNLQHSQMVMLYNQYEGNARSKKLFEDALPLLKTDTGISLMRDIIKSGRLDEAVVDSWFDSLTFYKKPTRSMLTVLSTFLEPLPAPPKSALLGISNLASTFCSGHPDCLQVAELRDLVSHLQQLLGTNCSTANQAEEETMVLVLKGLRNIGKMTGSSTTLRNCYKTMSNSMWVRVAAVDTIQTLTCHFPEADFGLMDSFTDRQEDSELRIGAYRALMTCPTEAVVEVVKVLLVEEQVNQVGSYVWTHLTNLQETRSKDDTKIYLKKLIGSEELQNKWSGDVRKFSRNVEFSQFFNDWRVGGTLDSNIIFSEKSYIPRSAAVNLTTSLFGENINLLEFGVRAEGFETMFESIFGPEGHFREDTIHDFLKHVIRSKRDVGDRFSAFGQQARDEDPRGSMYLRFFGKDIRYESFSGLPYIASLFNDPMSIFDLAYRDSRIDYEKSTMFLDGAIITSTMAGLPLNLTVQGTSSAKLKSTIDINLREFLQSGKAELEVDIQPKATMEIICIMSVDAFASRTGLKSTTKIHSSTEIGGSVHINGKKLVKAQMKMPREKLEIFEASVNYFFYDQEDWGEMISSQKDKDLNYCTPPSISDMFGMETCGNLGFFHGISLEDPTWLYAGPARADLTVKKTDSFQDMIFKYTWTTDNSNPAKGAHNDIYLIYDTPGSSLVRKTIFGVKFDEQGKYIDVDLTVPALDIKAQLKYDWTEEKKNINAHFVMAKQEILRLTQSITKYPNKFEGISQLSYFDKVFVDWTGILHSTPTSGRYSLDANLAGSLHPRLKVNGDLTKKGEKFVVNGSLESTFLYMKINSDCRLTDTSYKLKGGTTYALLGGPNHQMDISGKVSKTQQGELTTRNAHLDLKVSQFPLLKTTLDWKVQNSPGFIKNEGKVNIADKTWVVEQETRSFATMEDQELLLKFKLSVPMEQQEHYFVFHHRADLDGNSNKMAVKMTENFWFDIFAEHEYTKDPYKYLVKGGLSYPGRILTAGFDISQPLSGHGKEHDGTIYLQWKEGGRFEAQFNISQSNNAFIDYTITSSIKVSNMEPIHLNGNLARLENKTSASLDWNFGQKNYSAMIQYIPGQNATSDKTLTGKLDVNKEVYEGNVQLKNTMNDKFILVDLVANQHIYLLLQAQNSYNDIKFDFAWDKDKDATKRIFLETSLHHENLLAHVMLYEYEGKINGSYTSESVDATFNWGMKKADIQVKCVFTSQHIELLIGLQTTNTIFENIKTHILFMVSPETDGSTIMKSKAGVTINRHHHLLEATGKYGSTNEVAITTTSTYPPLDAFSVELSHTNTATLLHARLNGSYKGKYVLFDFTHIPTGHQFIPASGSLTIKTPLQQALSLEIEYSIALENGDLHASCAVARNANDSIKLVVVGEVNLPGPLRLNMTVDHSFGSKEQIHIVTELTQNEYSFNHTLTMTKGDFKLLSSLKARTYEELSFRYKMKTISPSPVRLKIEYHSEGRSLQSELKYQNIQMAALHIEHSYTSSEMFKSILKGKFLLNVLELEALRNKEVSLAKAQIFFENKQIMLTKVHYLTISNDDLSKSKFEAILLTPDHFLPQFDVKCFSEHKNRSSTAQLDFVYQEIRTSILKKAIHEEDGSYEHTFNSTSDIDIIRNLFAHYKKKMIFESETVSIDLALNDKNISVTCDQRSNEEAKTEAKVTIHGPWGTTKVKAIYVEESDGKFLQLQFIDSEDMLSELGVKVIQTRQKAKIVIATKNPITEPLDMTMELDMRSPHRLNLLVRGDKTEQIYVHVNAEGSLTDNRIKGDILVDVSIGSFLKNIDASADVNFSLDIPEIQAEFDIAINKNQTYEISFHGKKESDDLLAEFTLITPYTSFEKLDGKLEIDIKAMHLKMKVLRNNDIFCNTDVHLVIDDKVSLNMSAYLPIDDYSRVGILILIDYKNMNAELEGYIEDSVLALNSSLKSAPNKHEVSLNLTSSSSYWQSMNVNGKLDLSSGVQLIVSGKSKESSHLVDVSMELGVETGAASVSIQLPALDIPQKNIILEYKLAERSSSFLANFTGDVIQATVEFDGTAYRVSATTPFDGLEEISSRVTTLSVDDKTSIDAFFEVNAKVSTMIVYYSQSSNDFSIDVKTPYDLIRKGKAEFRQFGKATEVILAYGDIFVQSDILLEDTKKIIKVAYKSREHDIVLKYNREITSKNTRLKATLTYNGEESLAGIFYGNKQIFMETASPYYFKKALKAAWQDDNYELMLEYHDKELFNIKLKYTTGNFKGKIDFYFMVNYNSLHNLHITSEYDLLDADKALDLKFIYRHFFFETRAKWTMTHDTLDGVAFLKSSIDKWKEAIFEGSYTIKTKSEIKFSVDRNGQKEMTNLEIEIHPNHYIPTVHIKTTFDGYEEMKFRGNYTIKEGTGFIELLFEINREIVSKLYTDLDMVNDWSEVEVLSVFWMVGRVNTTIHFHYEAGIPKRFNLEVDYGQDMVFSILGQVSLDDLAFSLDIKTPIPDFEEFNFSGQLGATSIKSIASFRHGYGRGKRDLSFDYSVSKSGASIAIQTPLDSMKSVRFSTNIMSDSSAEFSFETEGEMDFSFGVKYNFSDQYTSGHILSVFRCPYLNSDYRLLIDYNDIDGNFENGFDVKFNFFIDGTSWLSGKAARSPGHTQIEVKTPLEGWKEVFLLIVSDWNTTAEFTFKRDSRQTKVHLEQHGLFNYEVNIETPYTGYEKVTLSCKKLDNTITLQVAKNNVSISEISLEAEGQIGSSGLGGSTGSLKVKWDSSKNIHVHINTSFDGVKAIFSVNTSFPTVKAVFIEVGVLRSGFNRKFKAIAKLNEKFLQYESLSSLTDVRIESKSVTKTNIELLGFQKSQTHFVVTYTADLTKPVELTSETKTDGVVTFDVVSSLKIDLHGGEVKLVYKGDFPCSDGKVDALLHIQANLETRFEIKGRWNVNTFRMKMLLGSTNAEAKLESSFENLENLKGRALWTVGKGSTKEYGLDVIFQTCQSQSCNNSLKFDILFDTKPYKTLHSSLFIEGMLNETLSATYEKNPARYEMKADYNGLKRLHMDATLDIPKKSVDITINNFSDDRNWRLKTNAEIDIQSVSSIIVNVQLVVRTPFTDDFVARVVVQFFNPMKEFELAFQYGAIDASLKTNVFWSPEETDLLFEVSCPPLDLQKISIEAKRKSFKDLIYRLTFNNRTIELVSKNAFNQNNFSVDVHLTWPMRGYEEIRLKAKGKKVDRHTDSGEVLLIVSGKTSHVKYSRDHLDLTIEIITPIQLIHNIKVKTNIKKCKNYDIEIIWNTSNIRLNHAIDCETFSSKINYESDFQLLEKLKLEFLPKGDGNFGVTLEFSGLGLNLNLNGDIEGSENGKHFSWKILSNGEHFSADMSYTLEDDSKHVNMTYAWATSKIIGINAILNTITPDSAEFVLEFTSPYEGMEYVYFDARMENTTTLDGTMNIEFNQDIISVQLGSSGDHLFVEVDTPIPCFEKLKVDINRHDGNVKAMVLYGENRVETSFVRKDTIYHFLISSNIGKTFNLNGKIDIEGKALTTQLTYDSQKVKMKANSNGKSMSVSFTSQFQKLQNIKIKGDWKWLTGGFRLNAHSDLDIKSDSINNEFHAEFVTNQESTTGFWVVRSGSEEIRFDLNVKKSHDEMGVSVSLKVPDMEKMRCHVFYNIDISSMAGAVQVESPWQDLNIEFKGGFKNSEEFEILTRMEAPHPIFDIDATMKVASLDDIEFHILCEIPSLNKSLGAEFIFRPRSLQDFEFFVTLSLGNEKFGGGAAFKLDGFKVDAQISVYTPVISGDYKMGGKYSTTPHSGLLSLYFNHATWEVSFNADTGNFSAKSKFDLTQFITSILGSIVEQDFPVIKEVQFEVEYTYMESMKILAKVEERGKVEFSYSLLSNRILGHLEVDIAHLEIAKIANFAFDYSQNGQLEIAVGDNGDWFELDIVGDDPEVYRGPRSVRAVMSTQGQSEIELEYDKAKSKGVFVLTTTSGIHKMSYNVKSRHAYDVTLRIESPYLNNGFASLKLLIDPENNKYEGHISLNNDHFFNGFFNLKNTGVDCRLQLDTTYLPQTLELKSQYQWEDRQLICKLEFSYKSKHKITLNVDIQSQQLYVSLNSWLIPFNQLTMDLKMKTHAEPYTGQIRLGYGEENIEVRGSFTMLSTEDILGQLSFSATQFTLSKASVDFSLFYRDKMELNVKLTTSNPKIPQVSLKLQLTEDEINHSFIGILQLPFTGHEHYQIEFSVDKTSAWTSKVVMLHMSAPGGEHHLHVSWTLTDAEILINLKLKGPQGARSHWITSLSWRRELILYSRMDLASVGIIQLDLATDRPYFRLKNSLKAKLQTQTDVFEMSSFFDFDDWKELEVTIKTPYPEYHNQRISLGFDNSERKMLKAHLTLWGRSDGLELEYKFRDVSDIAAIVKVDFPFPDWSDMSIEIRNQISQEGRIAKLELRLNENMLDVGYFGHNGDLETWLIINKNQIEMSRKESNGQTFSLDIQNGSSRTGLKFQKRKHLEESLNTIFHLVFNGKDRIQFYRNVHMKTSRIIIENLGLPYSISSKVVHDTTHISQLGVALDFNLCWDTSEPDNHSMDVQASLQRTHGGGDLMISAELPKRKRINGWVAVNIFPMKTFSNIHVFRGEEGQPTYERILFKRAFLLNTEQESEIHWTLGLPWQVFQISHRVSTTATASSSIGSFQWGQDKNSITGLGFLLNKDLVETRLILSRPAGSGELKDNSLAVVTSHEGTRKQIHVMSNHPQPERQFNIKAVSDLVNNDQTLHSNIHFTYSVQNSQSSTIVTDILYDKINQRFISAATASGSTFEVKGGWRTRGKVYSQELELWHNNVRVLQTDTSLNGHAPSARCKIRTRDLSQERVDTLLFVGMEEENEVVAKISHSSKGAEQEDYKLRIFLQDGNSISGKVDWRREALDDIQVYLGRTAAALEAASSDQPWNYLESTLEILRTATRDITGDLIRLTNIELNQAFLQVRRATSHARSLAQGGEAEALVGYYASSVDVFAEFGVEVADEIQVILRASSHYLNCTTDSAFSILRHSLTDLRTKSVGTKNKIIENMNNMTVLFDRIGTILEEAIWKMKHRIDGLAARFHQLVAFYTQRSARFRSQLWETLSGEVTELLESASEYLNQFVAVQKMVQLVHSAIVWVKDNRLWANLRETYTNVKHYIEENFQFLSILKEKIHRWYVRVTVWVVEKYRLLSEWPPMSVLISFTKGWVGVARKIIGFYLQGYSFRHITDMAISRFDFYTSTVLRVVNFIYNSDELLSYSFVYKPEEGLLHYTQVLPILWDRFSEMPKLFNFNILNPMEKPANPDITSFYFTMHNLVRTLYQAFASQTILPPFSSVAMIIGNNQLITFDQKFYDFSGNCSYLLAKDFNHNRFSVIANYKNEARESISIHIEEVLVKMKTDGRVLIDNAMIDLPYRINETLIWREGDRITLLNKMGLQVNCNLIFNTCSIKISGWYFAKTGGLLGVYDNEASNDWMTSSRTIVSDIRELADSWQIDDSCPASTYLPIQPDLTVWDQTKCHDYFHPGEESVLKPCFDVVDPLPYLEMCHRQSEYVKSQPSASEAFCQVTLAYIEMCKLGSVELRLPGECYSCQAQGKSVERGGGFTNYYNGTAPRSSDVVFVVQQGRCLEELKFPTILSLVESSMQEVGVRGNQYAVVGYGGPGELLEPITYTAASSVFTDHDTVLQALGRLSTRGSGGDIYEAITFAARLTNRAAVAKVVVAITCDRITDRSFYGDAIVMLKEGIIRLHYLNPAQLMLKNKKNVRTIYGFDKNSVYTAKSMKNRAGDSTLRSQLKVPKDYLSTLATESGGSVFSQTVLSRSFREQKAATSILGRRVASSGVPAACQICDCLPTREGAGYYLCYQCLVDNFDLLAYTWNRYTMQQASPP